MVFLYNFLAAAALVISSPWWLLRMAFAGKYRAGLRERLGGVPARLGAHQGERSIWIHAVSVGEVLAVSGLLRALKAKLPGRRIIISTTTATGQTLARERFGAENVFYFPLDLGFAIGPYLKKLRPELIVLAETEFWPNFLRLAKASGARIAVVNARISDRSLPGYRRWRGFMRRVLENVDVFLAQSEEDARRLVEIGAAAARTSVGGNLKFEVQAPKASPLVQQLHAAIPPGTPVLVCGSTVEGEEKMLLGAFEEVRREFPNALMILAPRHPERFDEVAAQMQGLANAPQGASGGYKFWRRSRIDPAATLSGGVLLLDSIGELAAVYSLATVALVGGSLAPRGGHNILEPARFAKAIIVGPHTENFRDVIAIFRQASAVRELRSGTNLESTLSEIFLHLLRHSEEREELGRRAAAVVEQRNGATERCVRTLAALVTNQPTAAEQPMAEARR